VTGTFWQETQPVSGTVGLTSGTEVALATGSVVGLANGAEVLLASGSQVGLVSNTEVALATGSVVGLANGAEVLLASGSQVGLVSGTEIMINNQFLNVQTYASEPIGGGIIPLTGDPFGRQICRSFLETSNGFLTSTSVSEEYNALHTEIKGPVTVVKPNAVIETLFTGAIDGSFQGALDMSGYNSFDLLVLIPAAACTNAGLIYVCVSDNNTDWYYTQYSVEISLSTSARRYSTTVFSLNCRYVCITGTDPTGAAVTTTTDSTIKVSAKK
jgi:hypothetical protein